MLRALRTVLLASTVVGLVVIGACTPEPGPDQVTALGGAYNSNCAVFGNGRVACWGHLVGSATDTVTPTTVPGLGAAFRITQGEGSAGHICVLVTGGRAWCWGGNGSGQLGPGIVSTGSATPVPVGDRSFSDIAAGGDHTCAVATVGGAVWCWGGNDFGQLGDGTTTQSKWPVQVVGITFAVSIVAGYGYSCALLVGGEVRCWGRGPIGNPAAPPTGTVVPLPVLSPDSFSPAPLTGAVAIAGGSDHVCVIRGELVGGNSAAGTVWCWGSGNWGQLGNGQSGLNTWATIPVQATGMVGATALGAGTYNTCAVSGQFTSATDGLACWGRSPDNSRSADSSVPLIANAQHVRSLHLGANSSCVDGELDVVNGQMSGVGCWGWNKLQQLGNPTFPANGTTPLPVVVVGL